MTDGLRRPWWLPPFLGPIPPVEQSHLSLLGAVENLGEDRRSNASRHDDRNLYPPRRELEAQPASASGRGDRRRLDPAPIE